MGSQQIWRTQHELGTSSQNNTKFLIVDDNNLDFEKITRSLARLKIENEILRAHDGIEALADLS